MTLQERIEAVAEKAREYNRKANSGDSECDACDWREAYCLMDFAFRAQRKLDAANEFMCIQFDPDVTEDPCLCETCVKNRALTAEAEELIAGLLDAPSH